MHMSAIVQLLNDTLIKTRNSIAHSVRSGIIMTSLMIIPLEQFKFSYPGSWPSVDLRDFTKHLSWQQNQRNYCRNFFLVKILPVFSENFVLIQNKFFKKWTGIENFVPVEFLYFPWYCACYSTLIR